MPHRSQRSPEPFSPHQVHFVAEQDGAPERELKERLAATLRPLGVRRAYLAVVAYADEKPPRSVGVNHEPATSVALCVTLQDGAAEKQDIVQRATADFSALFGQHQHMDIIFLTDQQELALARICRPFYLAMETA